MRSSFFSTPSNSPYSGGESISFCRRQFPSPSIGGRVRVGGRGELRNISFHTTYPVWERDVLLKTKMITIKAFPSKNVIAEFGNNQLEYNDFLRSISRRKKNFFALPEQVHSNNVLIVKQSDFDTNSGFRIFKNVDSLVTKEKDIFLVIKTADCIPILFFEPIKKIIGVAHAGREGTRLNIVKSVIQNMVETGAKIDSILVEMGPAISQKHYEVNQKIFQQFVLDTNIPQKEWKLDLKKVIFSQLIKEGIPGKNIINHKICTFEDRSYFSFRSDKTLKRQISFIGLSESFQTSI